MSNAWPIGVNAGRRIGPFDLYGSRTRIEHDPSIVAAIREQSADDGLVGDDAGIQAIRQKLAAENAALVTSHVPLDSLAGLRAWLARHLRTITTDIERLRIGGDVAKLDRWALDLSAAVLEDGYAWLSHLSGRTIPNPAPPANLEDGRRLIRELLAAVEHPDSRHESEAASEAASAELESRALALLVKHSEWTNKRIATELGCHPKSLSRLKRFAAARAAMRESNRDSAPRGRKDSEGNIDAWED